MKNGDPSVSVCRPVGFDKLSQAALEDFLPFPVFHEILRSHEREMLLPSAHARLFQQPCRIGRAGIMIFLIERTVHQKKRKTEYCVMIVETILHRFFQPDPDIFLLLLRAFQTADHVVRTWECLQDLPLILFLETGDQRNRRMSPADAVRLLQTRIQ